MGEYSDDEFDDEEPAAMPPPVSKPAAADRSRTNARSAVISAVTNALPALNCSRYQPL